MSLNVSKGNMYEFINSTWNTVKGKCEHDCSYCYMKRWKNQKPTRFDKSELKTDLGKDNFIFVGSSCDMWSKSIPEKTIIETLDYCDKFDNKYLFQSKNPINFWEYEMHPVFKRSVFCTTIETNRWYSEIMRNCPKPEKRAEAMQIISFPKYVTIEPIIDFDLKELYTLMVQIQPEQINVGADTGNNHLPEPPKSKILELISELENFTIVKQKTNLKRLLK